MKVGDTIGKRKVLELGDHLRIRGNLAARVECVCGSIDVVLKAKLSSHHADQCKDCARAASRRSGFGKYIARTVVVDEAARGKR